MLNKCLQSRSLLSFTLFLLFLISLSFSKGALSLESAKSITTKNRTNHANFPSSYLLIEPEVLALNKHANFSVNSSEQNKATRSLLIKEANQLLKLIPPTITNKTLLPPSKRNNDYMSIGPYWWPDAKKGDGKPWIRKDGEVNPITRNKTNDKAQLRQFSHAIKVLGLAYYFTDEIKYATKAEELLTVWFINSQTKMNPNLNFAQAVPGRFNGRGFGIIEFADLPNVLDAIYLVKGQLSPNTQQGLADWFEAFYHWMKTSKNGQDEAKAHNNHGSFYNFIMLSLSTSLDKKPDAITYINNLKVLIDKQINLEGKQPHELERTKPYHYSIYNLRALFASAKIAEQYQINLWHYPSVEHAKLKAAFEYMLKLSPIESTQNQWQALQKFPIEFERLIALFSVSAMAYPEFTEQASLLPKSEKIDEQIAFCHLVFPKVVTTSHQAPNKLKLCIL